MESHTEEAEAILWLRLERFREAGRPNGTLGAKTGGWRGCGVFRDPGGPGVSVRQEEMDIL